MNGPDPLPEPDLFTDWGAQGRITPGLGAYSRELVQRLVAEAYAKGIADAPGAGIIEYDID